MRIAWMWSGKGMVGVVRCLVWGQFIRERTRIEGRGFGWRDAARRVSPVGGHGGRISLHEKPRYDSQAEHAEVMAERGGADPPEIEALDTWVLGLGQERRAGFGIFAFVNSQEMLHFMLPGRKQPQAP